ncbi:hypothetical protein ABZ612_34735 [Streptomyces avermitilis]
MAERPLVRRRPVRRASLCRKARERALLSLAEATGPAVLIVLDWWARVR